MSNSSEQKDQHLGSDVQGAQPAAEAPQEADILTDSPGQEERLEEREAQSLGCARKKENTSGAAFVDNEVLRSQQDQARDYSSHAGTREDTAPTADRVGADAKMYERKLRKGLKKLSGLSWPSRDRLAVFSDVFDDVCEDLPVFGRILREIKTEYDLYINHMMETHSSQDNVTLQPFVSDVIDYFIVSDKEVEGAEKGVCSLEEEAKSALGENKRAQDELKNFPDECSSTQKTSLSRKEDSGMPIDYSDIVQVRKLQVLNVLEEIRHLEEEIHERMACAVANAATERKLKALKAETIHLIVSNDRMRTLSKDLQNNITLVLDREKPKEVVRRYVAYSIRVSCYWFVAFLYNHLLPCVPPQDAVERNRKGSPNKRIASIISI
uniref:Chromosome LG15 open reading frame, human C6orf118 n=1 Tax=Poecilia reticulata TaxID=8081 RepID=A0A3P9QK04_POERE